MYIYLCVKNTKLNIKNLDVNPASGGIPAIENSINSVENNTTFCLFQAWKLFNVLIFFASSKNKIQKNK